MTNGNGSKRILVIEDNRPLRQSLIDVLNFEGFDTLGADNGLMGVERAREFGPDLIICDIMMPDLDGYGVLKELRADPKYQTVPFIFLTARTERSDVRRGMEMGADDFLTKPFATSELIASVRTRLDKQALTQAFAEQRLDDLRNRLILSLPHELRTPLTLITGYSELLSEECRTMELPQIIEMTQAIHGASQRLWRLIENYLIYAQLEIAGTRPEWVETMLGLYSEAPAKIITNEARRLGTNSDRESDIELDLDLDGYRVQIGNDYLKKIVEELLSNSLKFSPPGTPIRVTATTQHGVFALQVADQGRGMSAEEIHAVGAYMQFERNLYEQQGSGLGLAIVRRLIELHRGKIKIESTLGVWTTVFVELPIILVN